MGKNKIKTYILAATVLTLTTIFTANTAFGMGKVTLTVKNTNPYEGNLSWFVYEKEAGKVIEDIASLKNFGSETETVNVYAVDASSNESGSFTLSLKEEEQRSIGLWTSIKTEPITIEPHEVLDIPFTITVPKGTPPGQYLGGIVAESGGNLPTRPSSNNNKNTETNGTSISVKTRIGSRVYLTIPGKAKEDIQLTDFTASKGISGITKFQFTIENNGNIAFDPIAHIEVYTPTGELYETIDEPLGTSSPNTVIKPTLKMQKKPLMGLYTAKTTVQFKHKFLPSSMRSAALYDEKEVTFWAIPWKIILTTLFVIFVILIIFINKKLAKKKYFANGEEYTVDSCVDLCMIGKDRNISWKKIAKYNKLEPPYVVKAGDKLIVPKKPKTEKADTVK